MTQSRPIPEAQQVYRHFKGNSYQIQCIASHSETGEEYVVYQALYGDYKNYLRPLDEFMSEVDTAKYPNADQKYRFELVTDTGLDPDVEKFLDADTYEQRLELLDRLQYRITDDMINIMSTTIDIDIAEGPVNKRFAWFKDALLVRRQYETGRLR